VGSQDDFIVAYRRPPELAWIPVPQVNKLETGIQDRVMHSAVIRGLDWNTTYEYRVHHRRAGEIVATYQHDFRTRLPAGDPRAFSFAAYGDSAYGAVLENFRSVQRQINQSAADFALLLGDHAYIFSNHGDYDARLQPARAPEAVEWTSGHIDFMAIGNHEFFDGRDALTSRELYANPIPRQGITSPVDLPMGEFAEQNYSFDYGNVHFVTFDSNPADLFIFPQSPEKQAAIEASLDRKIEYVVADLRASTAKWKIVYMHHTFFGTEKLQTPQSYYFQKVVANLTAAGADLVLVGHSHSYSWTYPIVGFHDADDNGVVAMDEVAYVADPDRSYDKGAGLIQLVAGVGGGGLRSVNYFEPLFASHYSLHELSGPAEHGFAQVDVSPRELKVSYISAESGRIVGDTNNNGLPDPDENFFGQFRIVDRSSPDPDANSDGRLDARDIDTLFAAAQNGVFQDRWDLDRNGKVDQADITYLLDNYLNAAAGDANLDGRFDSRDLVLIFQAGQYEDRLPTNSSWSTGDWNGDGEFNSADLVFAFQHNVYTV
jgi:hypothetical protein